MLDGCTGNRHLITEIGRHRIVVSSALIALVIAAAAAEDYDAPCSAFVGCTRGLDPT